MIERWERRPINPVSKDMYQKKNLSVSDDFTRGVAARGALKRPFVMVGPVRPLDPR